MDSMNYGKEKSMESTVTKEIIKAVCVTVAEYTFGKVGDKFYDDFLSRQKIKRILKKDEKFIDEQFSFQINSKINVCEFLFQDIYQNTMFLYPVTNIPKDRAKLLWERFCDYVRYRDDFGDVDIIILEDEYRNRLETCVNYHNELVSQYLLSESDRIILKTMHRNQIDILGYVGKTLDSNSELQQKSDQLDYTHKQIEGILHALRMDMSHYKFLLLLYSVGIVLTAIILILNLQSFMDPRNDLFGVLVGGVLLLIMLFIPFYNAMKNINKCENKISQYTDCLWNLHFESYKKQFETLAKSE